MNASADATADGTAHSASANNQLTLVLMLAYY